MTNKKRGPNGTAYFIYNKDDIRGIGSGVRKIYVTEKRKYAHIEDNYGRRTKITLNKWLGIKPDTIEVKEKGVKDLVSQSKYNTRR